MRLPVSEVPRRRADKLGNFVAVLKLSAVYLDISTCVAYKRFGHGFYQPGFSRPRGSKKKQVSNRTSRTGHTGPERLIDIHNLIHGFFLADNQLPQIAVKLFSLCARL